VVWPDALELLLVVGCVAARLPFAEPDVAACAARPGALALRLFAGRVAERQPFAEPDVVACVAWPNAWELWLVAARLPFAEPDVAARRVLQGPDVPLAHARRALLLPALAASVPAHRHLMAVLLQPKSELLSIAKVFS
jgi:hypothetical protein